MTRAGRARAVRVARTARRTLGCLDCGADLRVTREPHRYSLHPKWSITIADTEVRRCAKCGYFEVMVPKPDALHRTIAAEVIRKPARLSARKLARVIGVVHESISRWENDVLPLSPPVDRLMRTMVALTIAGERFPVDTLSQIEGDAGPLKLIVSVDPRGAWKRAA